MVHESLQKVEQLQGPSTMDQPGTDQQCYTAPGTHHYPDRPQPGPNEHGKSLAKASFWADTTWLGQLSDKAPRKLDTFSHMLLPAHLPHRYLWQWQDPNLTSPQMSGGPWSKQTLQSHSLAKNPRRIPTNPCYRQATWAADLYSTPQVMQLPGNTHEVETVRNHNRMYCRSRSNSPSEDFSTLNGLIGRREHTRPDNRETRVDWCDNSSRRNPNIRNSREQARTVREETDLATIRTPRYDREGDGIQRSLPFNKAIRKRPKPKQQCWLWRICEGVAIMPPDLFKDRTVKDSVGSTINCLTTMWALVITGGPSKLGTGVASKMPTTHKLAQWGLEGRLNSMSMSLSEVRPFRWDALLLAFSIFALALGRVIIFILALWALTFTLLPFPHLPHGSVGSWTISGWGWRWFLLQRDACNLLLGCKYIRIIGPPAVVLELGES